MLVLLIFGIAGAGAYSFMGYRQNIEYKEWIAQSEVQKKKVPRPKNPLDTLPVEKIVVKNDLEKIEPESVVDLQPIKIPVKRKDPNLDFINSYYENLGSGNVEAAYAVSKKSVPIQTYRQWYANVTDVYIDTIQNISDKTYSLRLTLYEGEKITRYAVLMTLTLDAQGSLKIEESTVRVLSDDNKVVPIIDIEQSKVVAPTLSLQSEAVKITNDDFKSLLVVNKNPFVLDAREDEEFAIGSFPKSTHVRFADIVAGEWIKIPTDQPVYVLCWSGIRGKEVADFLRTKKIDARYLENGADGWVKFGGEWNGGISFSSKYTQDKYKRLVSTNELKQFQKDGGVIVDSRHPDRYQTWHIPGSISIPIIYTPSGKIEEVFSQVDSTKSVITICDDFVSCFDAKIVGVKFESRGNKFIGRYNKPWEYRSTK